MKAAATLEIKNLTVKFKKPLFQNLNLTVQSKEFITIMGENGSGKSTLIDCLMGTFPEASGEILFWGQSNQCKDREKINRSVGWVLSQKELIAPWLKVQEILNIESALYPTWNEQICEKLLEQFQLDRKKQLGHLSMGEHSKLRLIKAMSFEPQLLILDELTANLSPESKTVVIETLLDLFTNNEMSILYICHSKDEALRLSDQIYTLTPDGLKNSSEV